MHSLVVVLMLAMIGQSCGPGGCPAPSVYRPSYPVQPSIMMPEPTYQPAPIFQPSPVLQTPNERYDWHEISHKGLNFSVWGVKLASGGVRWDPDLKENVTQFVAAREKAEQGARKPAPNPVPVPAPDPAPEPTKKAVGDPKNFGLDRERVGKNVGYSGNVREYGDDADKKHKLYLTVIGNYTDRQAFMDDWKHSPAFKDVKDNVLFNEFDIGEWQVTEGLGYYDNGKPTILVQAPSGRVVYRAYDYSAGPDPIIRALRRADPNYNPAKDPGPSQITLLNFLTPGRIVFAAAGVVALIILLPSRKVESS